MASSVYQSKFTGICFIGTLDVPIDRPLESRIHTLRQLVIHWLCLQLRFPLWLPNESKKLLQRGTERTNIILNLNLFLAFSLKRALPLVLGRFQVQLSGIEYCR
jgi:hypothetical protein